MRTSWHFPFCLALLAMVLHVASIGHGGSVYADHTGAQHGQAIIEQASGFLQHLAPREEAAQPVRTETTARPDHHPVQGAALLVAERDVLEAFFQRGLTGHVVVAALERCRLLYPFHIFW